MLKSWSSWNAFWAIKAHADFIVDIGCCAWELYLTSTFNHPLRDRSILVRCKAFSVMIPNFAAFTSIFLAKHRVLVEFHTLYRILVIGAIIDQVRG